MLADRDAGGEQFAMDGARAGEGVVDVVAVDADERRALCDEPLCGGGGGEEGVIVEIKVGALVTVPAGVDQHRLAANRKALEIGRVGGKALLERLAKNDRIKVGERLQRQRGKVVAVGIAVERAVDVGADIGDHVDAADLKARPVVINAPPMPRGSNSRTGSGRGSP